MSFNWAFVFLAVVFRIEPLMAATALADREPEATCATMSETDCPGGVALLLAKKDADGSDIDRCSSFLINSRTLVTNRHCIPEDLRDKTLSCAGRLTAVFPKTPRFAAERAECESILSISTEDREPPSSEGAEVVSRQADYAVIRLNRPVKRTPFRVSREGLPNGIKLTAYSFDPLPGSRVKAILRKKICESLQKTDLVPTYTDALSPVASFKGCKVIQGNSGSVAVDDKERVRAVVHATWPLDEKYVPFSVMTNMACLVLPQGFAPRDSRCDERRPGSFDFKALFAKAADFDFDSEFRSFQAANRGQFRFKKARLFLNERMVTTPQIECVEKAAVKPLVAAGSREATLSVSLPIWGPEKFITEDYRYEAVASRIASAFTTVQFDGTQLLAQGQVSAREIRGSFFAYLDSEYVLPVCGE